MIVDPALLLATVPRADPIHIWAKAAIFDPPLQGALATSFGLLPVDRGKKDYSSLYASTIACFDEGGVVAVFPEGTSYTQPHLYHLKDGAAWAALTHTFHLVRNWASRSASSPVSPLPTPPAESGNVHGDVPDTLAEMDVGAVLADIGFKERTAAIVPVGLTYVQKHKWRSSVVVQFGQAIEPTEYVAQFQKDQKSAVKKLTADLTTRMLEVTVNAPTWSDFDVANTARRIILPYPHLPLSLYPQATQALADLFRTRELVLEVDTWDYSKGKERLYKPDVTATQNTEPKSAPLPADLASIRNRLEDYAERLRSLSLVDLEVKRFSPQGNPIGAALRVLRSAVVWVLGLPVFVPMQVIAAPVQLPAYLVARNEKYMESKAMKKMVVSVLATPVVYSAFAFFLWRKMRDTFTLALFLGSFPILTATYLSLYDSRSDALRDLVGTYHLLLALAGPESSRAALADLVALRAQLQHDLRLAVGRYAVLPRDARASALVNVDGKKDTVQVDAARFVEATRKLLKVVEVLEKETLTKGNGRRASVAE
ncbi:hypothetical protein M427DRAFT_48313 [Gonapodya prolifera JEL478]|uniref:Phospholipid/glycerol acyltransferase domain-containing protein n=1 Tax=Gonapodya prolifera (strain JEL478) TaxID=1344416 RepID=A0A139A0U2_GONPJ|nr:hypothetical protein M427DRAFT_48313 [Gonapodya prolifera JEL478]|eukprot:KXS10381.1 hypothetical protein M427DRAFT_48313 [Gonapodya prolifera JEL478]